SFLTALGSTTSLETVAVLHGAMSSEWSEDKIEAARAGAGKHVGGPLYPPINAFYTYPLAIHRPQVAYRLNQLANMFLVFLAGLAVRQLAHGRLWWPVAVTALLPFPGFIGSLSLGQNATLTLTILLWGWVLIARNRPWAGGAVWG